MSEPKAADPNTVFQTRARIASAISILLQEFTDQVEDDVDESQFEQIDELGKKLHELMSESLEASPEKARHVLIVLADYLRELIDHMLESLPENDETTTSGQESDDGTELAETPS